ncbi:MAG TPA: DUF1844 domain-containing protein [Bryobacteraceae bacterium]|jgi:hypothetical protein
MSENEEIPVSTPQAAESANDAAEPSLPVPPATFEYLVATFRFQAEMQMGMYQFGEEGDKQEPNLDLARHMIDTLAMLEEKTRGNLSLEEKRLLENSITELRFRFVQAAGKSAKA